MPLFDLFVSAGADDSQLMAAILQTHQQEPSQQAPCQQSVTPLVKEASALRQRRALQELPPRQLNAPEPRKRPAQHGSEDASRDQRRRRRSTVVVDPCEVAEQRRLLKDVLPRLQAHETTRVSELPIAAVPHAPFASGEELRLGQSTFTVSRMIGSGTFGTVYSVSKAADGSTLAAKVSRPSQLWEWYVHVQLRKRLPAHEHARTVLASAAYACDSTLVPPLQQSLPSSSSASVLLLPLAGSSLRHLTECYHRRQRRMAERTVAFYAAGLLRCMQTLHTAQVLHADLRPDNVVLRAASCGSDAAADPSRLVDPSRPLAEGGWEESFGVALVDFGRAVDLKLYDAGVRFSGDEMPKGFDCMEMRRKETWTYQIDTFAAAATVHSLLHSDRAAPMKVQSVGGRCRAVHDPPLREISEAPGLWEEFFDALLNSQPRGQARVGGGAEPPVDPPDVSCLAEALEAHVDSSYEARVELFLELVLQRRWLRHKP